MGTSETKKIEILERASLLIIGLALFSFLNGCGSTGVDPSSGTTTTPTTTADTTLTIPVDSSVSASISKSLSKSVSKSSDSSSGSSSGSSSSSFSVGKGVSASAAPSSSETSENSEGGIVTVAKADTSSATSCDAYDGTTGDKINTESAKIEGGQAKLAIDSKRLSSADTKIKAVCGSLPILLDNDVAASLLKAKGSIVASKIPLSATSIQAFYQMTVGVGNVGAMTDNKLPANILSLDPKLFYDDVVKINADPSATLASAYQATQKAILGFMSGGGVGGIKDCGKFLQAVAGGDTALYAQAAGISASQASTYAELEKKNAQFTGPMFADPKIAAQYKIDPAFVTQMNSFRFNSFADTTTATKMASAMLQAPAATMTMFQDFSAFKGMNVAAATQVVTQAVDNNILSSGMGNSASAQFQASYTAAAQTNYSGMTAAAIKDSVGSTLNYVKTNNITTTDASTLTAVTTASQFMATQSAAGTLDTTKLDSAFMSALQTNIQTQVIAQVTQTQTQTYTQSYTQATSYITSFTSTYNFTSFVGGGTPAISDRFPYVGADTLLSVSSMSGISSPATPIFVKFSMSMDTTTLNSTNVTLTCNGAPINKTVVYDATLYKITVKPMTANGGTVPVLLPKNQTCILGLGAGIKSQAGVMIAANNFSFSTERDSFTTTVSSPASGAPNVPTNANISGSANYNIDSVTGPNISLSCGGVNVAGSLAVVGANFTFDPTANLSPSTNCTLTVGANLKDIYGRLLGSPVTRSFTTGLGSDVTNPDISGALAAWSATGSTISVAVSGATDDGTAANELLCDIYSAASSGGQSFASPTATSNAGCASAVVSSLSANTAYFFVIRVRDGTGNYSQMAEVSKKTGPAGPSWPSAWYDANSKRTSISFQQNAAGAVSVRAYRGLNCNSVSYIGSVDTPNSGSWYNFYDNFSNPVPYGTAYCYKLASASAVLGGGDVGDLSNAFNITVLLPSPGVTLSNVTASSMDISWNAVTDAASYKLYRSTDYCTTKTLVYSGTNLNFSASGLSADTSYSFCAFGVTSGSVDGNQGSNNTATLPNPPSALSCTGASSSSVNCTWSLPNNFYYLELQKSTGGGAYGNLYTRYYYQGSTTGYADSGLTAGTQYCYKIRAQTTTAYNYSAYSSASCVTPEVGAVGGVSAKARGPRRVSIQWNSLAGVTSYKVYAKTASGVTTSDRLVGEVTGTLINDAGLGTGGLTAGTAYYYKVLPLVNGVAGTLSSEVNATPAVVARAEGGGLMGWQTHTVFLKTNGTVWATGSNNNGQLGDNSTTDRSSPVQVVKGASSSVNSYIAGIIDIDAIGGHGSNASSTTIALKSDGTVWTWGDNDGACCSNSGLLGDGAVATNRSSPDTIANLTGVIDVAAGGEHMLVLKDNGTVWAWGGKNGGVALGDNTTNGSTSLVQVHGVNNVGNLENIVAIEAGYQLSFALSKDGEVYYWGGYTSINVLTPTLISGGKPSTDKIVDIAAGYRTMLALAKTGEVWGYGYNTSGQLGDNSTIARSTTYSTLAVMGTSCSGTLGGIDRIAITSGYTSYGTAYAIKNDGTVYSWGESDYGALGDGAVTDRKCSAQVSNLSNMVGVGAGGATAFVLDSSGNVKAWGYNSTGQLGDGSTTDRSTPVSVSNFP